MVEAGLPVEKMVEPEPPEEPAESAESEEKE